MNNKILLAALAGAASQFFLGWLSYALLANVYMANMGPAKDVMKDPPVFWAMILGNLLIGLLVAIIFGRWANIKTFATGAVAGAVLGLLMTGSFDLMYYGSTNIFTLGGVFLDVISFTIITGITGGVVGWLLGRNGK